MTKGLTALAYAKNSAVQHQLEGARIKEGAKTARKGLTALAYARSSAVQYQLAEGARIKEGAKTAEELYGRTVLDRALRGQEEADEIVKMLL